MALSRKKLYLLLIIGCFAGYIWLYFGQNAIHAANDSVEVCLIKNATNLPCPSCGSTRSVISLMQGNFIEAFKTNPLGYIIALIMLLAPAWILLDLACKKESLFDFYHKIESILKRPKYAIPFILLIVINWIWNITKGL